MKMKKTHWNYRILCYPRGTFDNPAADTYFIAECFYDQPPVPDATVTTWCEAQVASDTGIAGILTIVRLIEHACIDEFPLLFVGARDKLFLRRREALASLREQEAVQALVLAGAEDPGSGPG
jgi:hypothetical protein